MKQKIIITGISGFLGSRLKETLKEEFHLFGIGRNENFDSSIKIFSSQKLKEIDFEPDYIVMCHAAVSSGNIGQSVEELYNVNVLLTKKIINKFCTSKIIYISTASIFNTENIITEQTTDNPKNQYAISKLWAEKIVLKQNNSLVIRLSSVFGKGMKEQTIIPNYVNQALDNSNIKVWGNGKRLQNYIFVDDICLLIKKAITNFSKARGKVFLGVAKKEYSNLELAKIIAKKTSSEISFINQDNSISLEYNNLITQETFNWKPNSKFKEEIIKYILWKEKQF